MNRCYQNGTCTYKELYFRVYRGCDLLEQRYIPVSNKTGYIWRESERFGKKLVREWTKKLELEPESAREFSVDYGEEKIELQKHTGKVIDGETTGGYRDFPEDD